MKFRQIVWTAHCFEFQAGVTSDLDLLAMEMIISFLSIVQWRRRTVFVHRRDGRAKQTSCIQTNLTRWQWSQPRWTSRNPAVMNSCCLQILLDGTFSTEDLKVVFFQNVSRTIWHVIWFESLYDNLKSWIVRAFNEKFSCDNCYFLKWLRLSWSDVLNC